MRFATQLEKEFYFEGGDSRVAYDIVNWQAGPDGLLRYVPVGRVEGSELVVNDSAIVWPDGHTAVSRTGCDAEDASAIRFLSVSLRQCGGWVCGVC